MVTNSKRIKLEQKIAELQEKLSTINDIKYVNSKSEGFPDLIEKLNEVIKLHQIDTATAIEVLLKAKRTGLTLTKK